MKRVVLLLAFAAILGTTSTCHAALLFFDDFNSGANSAWGNERGDWFASVGVYDAASPSNNLPTYSSVTSLPDLTDFIVELDVNNLSDGGIWLRSTDNENGVLLVTGGVGGTNNGFYWTVIGGNGSGIRQGGADIPGLQGSNVHLKIEVVGDAYKAYLNGATTPTDTLITNAFSSGRVALYDFSGQTFDNVALYGESVIPEPSSLLLLGLGLFGSRLRKRKR